MIQLHGDIDHAHVCIMEYCQDTLIGHFLDIVTNTSSVTVTVTATDTTVRSVLNKMVHLEREVLHKT